MSRPCEFFHSMGQANLVRTEPNAGTKPAPRAPPSSKIFFFFGSSLPRPGIKQDLYRNWLSSYNHHAINMNDDQRGHMIPIRNGASNCDPPPGPFESAPHDTWIRSSTHSLSYQAHLQSPPSCGPCHVSRKVANDLIIAWTRSKFPRWIARRTNFTFHGYPAATRISIRDMIAQVIQLNLVFFFFKFMIMI